MIKAYYYDSLGEKRNCKILDFVAVSYEVKAVVRLDDTGNLLAIDIHNLIINEVLDEN